MPTTSKDCSERSLRRGRSPLLASSCRGSNASDFGLCIAGSAGRKADDAPVHGCHVEPAVCRCEPIEDGLAVESQDLASRRGHAGLVAAAPALSCRRPRLRLPPPGMAVNGSRFPSLVEGSDLRWARLPSVDRMPFRPDSMTYQRPGSVLTLNVDPSRGSVRASGVGGLHVENVRTDDQTAITARGGSGGRVDRSAGRHRPGIWLGVV